MSAVFKKHVTNLFFRPSTYREALPGNTQEFQERIAHLKKEISKLDEYENLLDRHKMFVEQSILNVTEDIDTQRYLYVTHEDLVKCYGTENTILVVNAPFHTSVSVHVSSSCDIYETLSSRICNAFIIYLFLLSIHEVEF